MGFVIPRPVVRRSIMLLVSVAMLALTLISLAGMLLCFVLFLLSVFRAF